jgi:hypothetical protein
VVCFNKGLMLPDRVAPLEHLPPEERPRPTVGLDRKSVV